MNAVIRTLFVALLVAGVCFAQQKCKVEGGVADQTGRAITGASITIKSSLNTGSGTTDKQGKYAVVVLCTETSKHTVTVAKAGYLFQPPSTSWDKYSGGPNFTGRTEQPKK